MGTTSRSEFRILPFYLPLAATGVMMALSSPIINAGLARRQDPELELSAYALAFHLSILLHSPVFMAQQTAVAKIRGRVSLKRLRRFIMVLGLGLTLVETFVAFSPLGIFCFHKLFGAPLPVAQAALAAYRLFLPIAFFISQRSLGQAALMLGHDTASITLGTLSRLIVIAAGTPIAMYLGGASAATALITLAVLSEMTVVRIKARPHLAELAARSDSTPPTDTQDLIRFFLPLAATIWLWTLSMSALNAIILRTGDAEEALAAWAVLAAVVWLTGSPCLWIQQTALTLATDGKRRRAVRLFAAKVALSVSLLFALLAVPAVRGALLGRLAGLTPRLLSLAGPAIIVLIGYPFLLAGRAYLQGLLMLRGKTPIILKSALSRVVIIALVGFPLASRIPFSGTTFAALLLLAMMATETVLLLFGCKGIPGKEVKLLPVPEEVEL